jgi:hypothetical protein
MKFSPDKLMKVFGSGLVSVMGPQLLEGMFLEWIKTVKTSMAIDWIAENKNLWNQLDVGWQANAKKWGSQLDLSFVTAEWFIDAATPVNPGLASLFMNWPEAKEWLERNLKDLREKIYGG